MSNIITINSTSLTAVEYQGQRVVTFAMIDQVHERPEGTAKNSFQRNKDRFIVGTDFFELSRNEIRSNMPNEVFAPKAPKGIILTESGYLMLVKPMNDDLSWQVQRQLVKSYFRVANSSEKALPKKGSNYLAELRQARTADIRAKIAERYCIRFSNLSTESQQTIYASMVNPALGYDAFPLPVLEKIHFTASEIGKMLGISAQKVGRIANKLAIKSEQYGITVLDKSKYSDKQVVSFRYNEKALDLIRQSLVAPPCILI